MELVVGKATLSPESLGKVGVSSDEGEPSLSNQLPDERRETDEKEESMGDVVATLELSLVLGLKAEGEGAMTNTSSEIKNILGTCGTGGTSSPPFALELVEVLAADEADLERIEGRNERVSNDSLLLMLWVGVLGVLGVDGIEAYASTVGREGPDEKRYARRLKLSSLGGTARVAVDCEARFALLLLTARLEDEEAALGLPSESLRTMLRFDFFSAPAGREMVEEEKLCIFEASTTLLYSQGCS